MKPYKNNQNGQALTSLLIIMFVGLTIMTASVGLINTTQTATGSLDEANQALVVAESGIEDTLMKYIRNPSISGGTLAVDGGLAVVSIASTNPYTFVSQGIVGQHSRTIRVTINNTGGITTVTSWKEQ